MMYLELTNLESDWRAYSHQAWHYSLPLFYVSLMDQTCNTCVLSIVTEFEMNRCVDLSFLF